MKRILLIFDDKTFKQIEKVKKYNKHTWEQCMRAYADHFSKKNALPTMKIKDFHLNADTYKGEIDERKN